MIKIFAKTRLFFIWLKIVWGGGLAKPETWKEKEALENIIKK